MTRTASAPSSAAVDDLEERVHARLDPRLGDEQRHQEGQRRDQEPVLRVADDVRHRHPAPERDRGVTRRKPAAERRPAAGVAPSSPSTRMITSTSAISVSSAGASRSRSISRELRFDERIREDEVADGDGVHGRDQHRARGDVLRELRERVEGGRRHVDRPPRAPSSPSRRSARTRSRAAARSARSASTPTATAAISTAAATAKWMRRFRCVRRTWITPSNAKLKLSSSEGARRRVGAATRRAPPRGASISTPWS